MNLVLIVTNNSKLERLYKLPSMLQMATKLIRLKNNSNVQTNDLAKRIHREPSLMTQIIRHAKSVFFNYRSLEKLMIQSGQIDIMTEQFSA